jgi:hypothetical protein
VARERPNSLGPPTIVFGGEACRMNVDVMEGYPWR